MKKITLLVVAIFGAFTLTAQLTGSKIVTDFAGKLAEVKLKSEGFAQNVKKNWNSKSMQQDLIDAQKRYNDVRVKQISIITTLQEGIRHKISSKKMAKSLES